MKKLLLPIAGALAVSLVSCNKESSAENKSGGHTPPPPAAPAKEVVAALEAQPIGKKLLGNTHLLSGKSLVKSDLQVAPEFYFVYYSASW